MTRVIRVKSFPLRPNA